MIPAYLRWPAKDPSDSLDYSIDWTKQLALPTTADTIATVVWTVPTGLTAGPQILSGNVTTAWLSGGTNGVEYLVTCRITTANNRIIERSVRIVVQEL